MNEVSIETETRPVAEWLPRENSEEVVYLTRGGRTKFVLLPLDEGDEEVIAIRKNAALMSYIAGCVERARLGPTKSLAQIKQELNIGSVTQESPP